ncbi:dihydropteroate synthase [Desulfoluna spongiiphila]|uniref:5-methyltetrahydrofolate--homocysteine methyltransferase n=1 Tax=Desulfoluna spongiiphila TaxID=419481 RepID=A0A1G5EI48_9BACT|nr:dihydropteroate synthase [Desulfoluna spongiiphila]SCY26627.1 5-methyltetrahydrofolate--homocysteine methyltransferase [Desulfoluna spongiiphila]
MFTVIGERINTTLKKVKAATADRDADYIREDVKKQEAAGATYIDVNAGARIGHEEEDMKWLLSVVREVTDLPLCLDSPDPAILEMAYGMVDRPPLINSISLEKDRFDPMIRFLKGKECRIIALCMDDSGMPKTVEDIFSRAKTLVEELEAIGVKRDDIFIDPLIQPMSVAAENGTMAMDAVEKIMTELKGVHTTGGLSNISYGLPQRKVVNRIFLAMMMVRGFDSAIMDPLDKEIMAVLTTASMLQGHDTFCMNYLKAVRAGDIVA